MNTKSPSDKLSDLIIKEHANKNKTNGYELATRKNDDLFAAMASPITEKMYAQLDQANHEKTSSFVCENVIQQAKLFEESLSLDKELGAQLASFGTSILIHVKTIKPIPPNMIIFGGLNENGEAVSLVQHMNQLSVLFVAVDKIASEPFRLGFYDLNQPKQGEPELI
jgi:Family of unknown function (DUF6173)